MTNLTPENTIVEDLHKAKKVTLVYDVNGNKERIVAVYNPKEKKTNIVEKINLPKKIQPYRTVVKIDSHGKKAKITNDISVVRKEDENFDRIIEEIKHTYPFINDGTINGIQTQTQSAANIYTIMTVNDHGKEQQITVSLKHKNDEVVIIDDQEFPKMND